MPWIEHEWFPPSLCGWESVPLIAATVGAASSVGGTILSARSASQQAESQASALQAKAAADRVQANQEAAVAQRQALADRQKTDYTLSRLQAVAAAQGGNATDPSTVALSQQVAGQGEYNALAQVAAGNTRQAALNYQSDIDLFNANRYRAAVGPAVAGTYASGIGNLAASPLFRPNRFGGFFGPQDPYGSPY